jgi:hypothetical protein
MHVGRLLSILCSPCSSTHACMSITRGLRPLQHTALASLRIRIHSYPDLTQQDNVRHVKPAKPLHKNRKTPSAPSWSGSSQLRRYPPRSNLPSN